MAARDRRGVSRPRVATPVVPPAFRAGMLCLVGRRCLPERDRCHTTKSPRPIRVLADRRSRLADFAPWAERPCVGLLMESLTGDPRC